MTAVRRASGLFGALAPARAFHKKVFEQEFTLTPWKRAAALDARYVIVEYDEEAMDHVVSTLTAVGTGAAEAFFAGLNQPPSSRGSVFDAIRIMPDRPAFAPLPKKNVSLWNNSERIESALIAGMAIANQNEAPLRMA
jgi:hypothetical protein